MLEENLNNINLENINSENINSDDSLDDNIQIYLQKNIKIWCYICAIIVGAIIWHYSNI